MNRNRDSKDKKAEKEVDKSKQKKRGGGSAPQDDDEVDSRGNLRGLIAYSDESEYLSDEESPKKRSQSRKSDKKMRKVAESEEEEDARPTIRRGFQPRKVALKANENIKRKLRKMESGSYS